MARSSVAVEARNYLSAVGRAGALRLRRAAVRVLSAGVVDSRRPVSAIFPWTVASCVYIWIVLVLSGVSMFAWRGDGSTAAMRFLRRFSMRSNPYHLVIVYWRSAFAELLASCLVPLLLLFVLKAVEQGWRAVVPLSAVLAAAWLTNAPAAVMIHYSLALLVVFFAWQKRSPGFSLWERERSLLGACWRRSICYRRFMSSDGSILRRRCRQDRVRRITFCSFIPPTRIMTLSIA